MNKIEYHKLVRDRIPEIIEVKAECGAITEQCEKAAAICSS